MDLKTEPPLQLIPEPENKFDNTAIRVMNAMLEIPEKVGYIPAKMTRVFNPILDSGSFRNAFVHKVEPEEGSAYINIALGITYDLEVLRAYLEKPSTEATVEEQIHTWPKSGDS